MVVVERAAEFVLDRIEIVEALFRTVADHGDFVGGALQCALSAAAIVAFNEYDQRVVADAFLLQRVEHAPDIVVVVGEEGGIDFRHMRKELLVLGVQRVPGRQIGGSRRQDSVLRYDAELFLPRKSFLAQLVPALIELTLELRDPFLWNVMGRVRRPGRVIGEERLVGRQRMLLLDPVDRLVGEIGVKIVVRLVRSRSASPLAPREPYSRKPSGPTGRCRRR